MYGSGNLNTAEFWEYDTRLGRRWNIDPVVKPWISPYHAFSNKPITNVDPNGDDDGWIEDKDGNVSWDSKTNSEADFKKNYTDKGKTGFKYASDKDNSKAYSLPSGEGKLIVDNWGPPLEIEDGLGGTNIAMTFEPTDKDAETGWTQTFSTNYDGTPYTEGKEGLPVKEMTEYLDGHSQLQHVTDATQAQYFESTSAPFGTDHGRAQKNMYDSPSRARNVGAQYASTFKAQATVLINGKAVITVGYGFSVLSQTYQRNYSPKILKNPTKFHKDAVLNLSKKILKE